MAEDGTVVPNAMVEFWARARRILTVNTRGDGLVIVERKRVPRLTSVSARAIGFLAASVPSGDQDTVVVRLTRVVPRLPEIVVQAAPRYECRPEDREARAAWRALSARYALPQVPRGYWATGRALRDTFLLSSPTQPGAGDSTRWSVSGNVRALASRFIRDSGYAIRIRPGRNRGLVGSPQTGPWWYPRLHSWNADHFARPEFGDLNTLYLISAGPTGWTIGFCSNRAKRPGIAGTMRIDSTYRLVRAEWEFQTPRPKEDAGGEVVFLAGTDAALLPLESYFWKRIGEAQGQDAHYLRDTFRGDQWTINLDGGGGAPPPPP